jgi:hypothetical protein
MAPGPNSSAGISRSHAASMKSTSSALKKRYVGLTGEVSIAAFFAGAAPAGSGVCIITVAGITVAAPTVVTKERRVTLDIVIPLQNLGYV